MSHCVALQELCRHPELTELVIDPTELQQLAQRFQFPEPADYPHVRNGKLDEVEQRTRQKTVDDMAKDLHPGLQPAALSLIPGWDSETHSGCTVPMLCLCSLLACIHHLCVNVFCLVHRICCACVVCVYWMNDVK